MFQLTDVGTDISAPTSVIAAVIPFSLFTAYQFLSSNRWFWCLLKAKCDHLHHVCADGLAPWWWRWSRRAFLCLLRINFWVQILFSRGLDNRLKKSYNTTPVEEGMRCSSLLRPHNLTMWVERYWPHSFRCFLLNRPHVVVGMFSSLLSMLFFAADEIVFECIFHTSKWWPHIIFSDTDLTTFLTIVTSGVHGDKMSGEYEKAVFA